MVQTFTQDSCPAHCPGCSETTNRGSAGGRPTEGARSAPGDAGGPGGPGDPSGLLEGWRLVAASVYVFVLPLAAVIAAVAALGGRLGEPGALGVGLAGAAILMLPAWRVLRRRPGPGHDGAWPSKGPGHDPAWPGAPEAWPGGVAPRGMSEEAGL